MATRFRQIIFKLPNLPHVCGKHLCYTFYVSGFRIIFHVMTDGEASKEGAYAQLWRYHICDK